MTHSFIHSFISLCRFNIVIESYNKNSLLLCAFSSNCISKLKRNTSFNKWLRFWDGSYQCKVYKVSVSREFIIYKTNIYCDCFKYQLELFILNLDCKLSFASSWSHTFYIIQKVCHQLKFSKPRTEEYAKKEGLWYRQINILTAFLS